MALPSPTYQGFLVLFPEFANEPQASYVAWETVAEEMIIEHRWRGSYALGVYLYIAHCITLGKLNAIAWESGDPSTTPSGPMSGQSKKVGDVSVSNHYAANLTALKNQGQWGKTDYGQRFYQLMRMIGVAPLQS